MRRALAPLVFGPLLGLALAGCPDPPAPIPAYPWDELRPAIASRLPWSTMVIEPVPCGFDPGEAVLALDEDGGLPLPAFLHAKPPKHFQRRVLVFRPSLTREPVFDGARNSAAELSGWLFAVDGASLEPLCQAPVEARVPAADGPPAEQIARWRAAYEAALAKARERLVYGGSP